mgnify:CR=1 FL=1
MSCDCKRRMDFQYGALMMLEFIASHRMAEDTELQVVAGIETFWGVFSVGMIRELPKE